MRRRRALIGDGRQLTWFQSMKIIQLVRERRQRLVVAVETSEGPARFVLQRREGAPLVNHEGLRSGQRGEGAAADEPDPFHALILARRSRELSEKCKNLANCTKWLRLPPAVAPP